MRQSSDILGFLTGHMVFTKEQLARAIRLFAGHKKSSIQTLSAKGWVNHESATNFSRQRIFSTEVKFLKLSKVNSFYRVCSVLGVNANEIKSSKVFSIHQLLVAECDLLIRERLILDFMVTESFFRNTSKNNSLYFRDNYPDLFFSYKSKSVVLEVDRFRKSKAVYSKKVDLIYQNPEKEFVYVVTNPKVLAAHKKNLGFLRNVTFCDLTNWTKTFETFLEKIGDTNEQ